MLSTKHLLLASTIIAAAAAFYLYNDLKKCKTYIKSLPDGVGTVDGMPPHN